MKTRHLYKCLLMISLLLISFFSVANAQNLYGKKDLKTTWDENTAIFLAFEGKDLSIKGKADGILHQEGVTTITRGGTYVLSGTGQGQVVLAVPPEEDVFLVLHSLHLTSPNGPAIWGQQGNKTIITLAQNTENLLEDSTAYTVDEKGDPNAVIYTQEDLTFNGSGSLQVRGQYKHGIVTKDDLLILSGDFSVTAPGSALRGRDSVTILGGNFLLRAGTDGIQSNNDKGGEKGSIYIEEGIFDILAGKDGIQAQNTLTLNGGDFLIKVGKEETQALFSEENPPAQRGLVEKEKGKGLQGNQVKITGGTIDITSIHNGIHGNQWVDITGGHLRIHSQNRGIHGTLSVAVRGGDIGILDCREGIEGEKIFLEGGEISIASSDDGINASGGDTNKKKVAFDEKGEVIHLIAITGGIVHLDVGGDGLDSNGDILLQGGTLFIEGPPDRKNSAIDYNGTFTLHGGNLLVATKHNNQWPATDRPGILTYHQGAENTSIFLTDQRGEEVMTWTPKKAFDLLVFVTENLKEGEKYTLHIGEETIETPPLGKGLIEIIK
ncbi:MAG: carbohydrate-binding domain-containing protein [Clostridiales bacterium]|nr:carbohydrate-binding domain-containing protein [Clostridiales bacterium]